MTIKECIKYVYEPKDKDERKNRICQLVAEWLTENATENKMAFVAALFGRSLGEEFTAVIWDVMQKWNFTDEGLKVKYLDGDWHKSDSLLRCLLTGEAEIMEE